MSFTGKLLGFVRDSIPFGREIFPHGQSEYLESSHQTEARNSTARRMKQAIKEGKLNPKYLPAVKEMAKKKDIIASKRYDRSQYPIDQAYNAASLVGLVPPMKKVGELAIAASRLKTAHHIINESAHSSYRDALIRTAGLAVPIVWSTTVKPALASYMTATTLISTGALVLGTALAVDAVSSVLKSRK